MTYYYIWSYRHHQWWGPNRAGYTSALSQAGQYNAADAGGIMLGALPGQNVAFDTQLAKTTVDNWAAAEREDAASLAEWIEAAIERWWSY